MAKVAKKTEESPRDADDFEVPAIRPNSVSIQSEGFVFKTYMVRLPEHMIAQDLHDHPDKIWIKIQADQLGKALTKFDRVICIAFDESWMLEAVVAQAGRTRVVLAGNKITQLPGAVESLFADATYQVKWAGDGYGVYRIIDNIRVGNESWPSPEAAKAGLMRLYPVKVAS